MLFVKVMAVARWYSVYQVQDAMQSFLSSPPPPRHNQKRPIFVCGRFTLFGVELTQMLLSWEYLFHGLHIVAYLNILKQYWVSALAFSDHFHPQAEIFDDKIKIGFRP